MSVSVADVGFGLLMAVSAFWGLQRGLAKELLSVAILALAILGASLFGAELGSVLPLFGLDEASEEALGPDIQRFLGIGITFVLFYLAGWFVLHRVQGAVEESWLAGPNKTLGFLFGGLRGVLVAAVVVLLLNPTMEVHPWWAESLVVQTLQPFTDELQALWRHVAVALGWTTEVAH